MDAADYHFGSQSFAVWRLCCILPYVVSPCAPSNANAIILIIFSTMDYAINDPATNLREHISAISILLRSFC
jgi:hypothetical protein